MELWDILTAKGEPTGRTTERGTTLKPGEYHLVVHIWPVNTSGALLIQRRSPRRKLMPGEWAATGGSAVSGESSIEAAKRELFEELSIKADDLTLIKRIKKRNSFVDVYGIVCSCNRLDLTLQKSEVAECKWVNFETLQNMIDNKEYHNYGKEYFALIKDFCDKNKGVTK